MTPHAKLLAAAALALSAAACTTTGSAPMSPTAAKPYSLAMSVDNIDRSIAWYAGNLGFREISRRDGDGGARSAVIEKDGFRLELVQLPASKRASEWIPNLRNPALVQGLGQLGFEVASVDTWAAKARAGGAKIIYEPRDNAQGTRVMILEDPDGNQVKVVQRIPLPPIS
jgi:catechol 2,3-dioxygenase-like lactoylglutathione lyase family enzyme